MMHIHKISGFVLLMGLVAVPALAAPFSLAIISDTQYLSQSYPATYQAITQWIVDNQAVHQIVFATHVGDVVEAGSNVPEWENASASMTTLDGVVPYGISMGNHDVDNLGGDRSTNFRAFFPTSRMALSSTYAGAAPDGLSSYHTFTADGQDFLSLHLDLDVSDAGLLWAQNVLDAHRNIPTILTTHTLIAHGNLVDEPVTRSSGNSALAVWNSLVMPNNQVFMTVNGHTPGIYHDVVTNQAGLNVYRLMIDYQFYEDQNCDLVGLLTFDRDNSALSYQAYNTITNTVAGNDLDMQFVHTMDFEQRFSNQVPNNNRPHSLTSFRNGENGYFGVQDTYITEGDSSHRGNSILFRVDGDQGEGTGLIKFENIIGDAAWQVPSGVEIVSAMLVITTGGTEWAPTVGGARVHRMSVDWNDTTTWDGMGDGIQLGTEALAEPDCNLAAIGLGVTEFDVTQAVQAWADGAVNYGWVMKCNTADGWQCFTSEYGILTARPQLVVAYVPEPTAICLLLICGFYLRCFLWTKDSP